MHRIQCREWPKNQRAARPNGVLDREHSSGAFYGDFLALYAAWTLDDSINGSHPEPCMPAQIPGPRIDGRVLVSGTSQYYTPFVTVKVRVL